MSYNPSITRIVSTADAYPEAIRQAIKKPPELYCMGNLELLEKAAIGFCGSRKVSENGLETTYEMAKNAVANDMVVISGNAKGVDAAAHFSALENGGETILVLPEGIDFFRIRAELKSLWDWQRTLVISQFSPQAQWQGWRAMERNKLVVGLSDAVIILEAGEKGGTLDASNVALRLGKTLFVADYDTIPKDAVGNSLLLSKGGEKLNIGDNFLSRMTPAQASMPF